MELKVNWEPQSDFTPENVNAISNNISGVYIIWAKGKYHCPNTINGYFHVITNPIVYVGSGIIAERLEDHLRDEDPVMQVKRQLNLHDLRFAYAPIEREAEENEDMYNKKCDGAENYLAYIFRPIPRRTERYPNEHPREINLPSQYPDRLDIKGIVCFYPIENVIEDPKYWENYVSDFNAWAEMQHGENYKSPIQ